MKIQIEDCLHFSLNEFIALLKQNTKIIPHPQKPSISNEEIDNLTAAQEYVDKLKVYEDNMKYYESLVKQIEAKEEQHHELINKFIYRKLEVKKIVGEKYINNFIDYVESMYEITYNDFHEKNDFINHLLKIFKT